MEKICYDNDVNYNYPMSLVSSKFKEMVEEKNIFKKQ